MHRSGITVTEDLREVFQRAQSTNVRWIKIKIEDEKLLFVGQSAGTGNIEHDFDEAGREQLEEKDACYIVFRTDKSNSPRWLLVSYVPDLTPVKYKMMYASSRAELKQQLGFALFDAEYFVGDRADCTWRVYQEWKRREESEAPLTEAEILRKEEAKLPTTTEIRSQGMASLPVKISDACRSQMTQFTTGVVNWIELIIDAKDCLDVGESGTFSVSQAQGHVHPELPRFYLYAWQHLTGSGESKVTQLFVYHCPDNATVRQKMTYSTLKSSVLKVCEYYGIFPKQVETRDAGEFTEQTLHDTLYADFHSSSRGATLDTFAKPKRPGKGKARLVTASKGAEPSSS